MLTSHFANDDVGHREHISSFAANLEGQLFYVPRPKPRLNLVALEKRPLSVTLGTTSWHGYESGNLLFNPTYLAAHVANRDTSFLLGCALVSVAHRASTYVHANGARMQRHVHYASTDTAEPSWRFVCIVQPHPH